MRIVHISISDGQVGAGIAAGRLHSEMSKKKGVYSKMLVAIKTKSSKSVQGIGRVRFLLLRLFNFLNNRWFCRYKVSQGLFSFATYGLSFSNQQVINSAQVIYIHWVNNGMLSWAGIQNIIDSNPTKAIFLFCHDMWYFTGGCHQSNGCTNYRSRCEKCIFFNGEKEQKRVKNLRSKKKSTYDIHENVQMIVPSSQFLLMARNSKVMSASRIHFIPNVLNDSIFYPYEQRNATSSTTILYGAMGGKHNPYKGWGHFVKAINGLPEEIKNRIEIFVFGYDFEKTELDELPFNINNLGIIRDEKSLAEIYRRADIFLFPSLQESFGQTLFEAMHCGSVPIAYNVGAAQDLIIDGFNGFVIPVGNQHLLSSRITDIIKNDILVQMRNNCVQYMKENFSSEVIVDNHLELIKKSMSTISTTL
jgi:glycosyltransferase involved in cell wall biosynthesis